MKILNTKLARQAIAAALILSAAAAMSIGAVAAEPAAETSTEDAVIAGYLPPQDEMIQGDIALHTGDSQTPVQDSTFGGYASPVENPVQGDIMLISAPITTLPSDTLVESRTDTETKAPYTVQYTVKGAFGKKILFTATQEGRVMTLAAPEDVATFRTTIGEMQKLLDQGVSTVVLTTNKKSTTLNLTLLCSGQNEKTKVTLRHIGDSASLTVGLRCRRDLLIGR